MAKLIDSLNNYSVTPGYASASVVLLSPNSGNTKDLIIYADGEGYANDNMVELAPFLNNNNKSIIYLEGSINKNTVSYSGNVPPAIEKYTKDFSSQIDLNIIGFSGGTTSCINLGCEQAQIINEDGSPRCSSITVNVISTAYGYMDTNVLTDQDYQALASANGKVVFYCHDTSVADSENQKTHMSNVDTMKGARVTSDLARNGVPTYVVETHYIEAGFSAPCYGNPAGHASVNQTVMKYFIPMLYGTVDENCDKYFDIETPVVDENGNITSWRKVNSKEISEVFSNTYMQVFNEKYSDLANINTDEKKEDNTLISSCLSEVYDGMVSINSDIANTSSLFKLDSVTYADGTCNIPKNLSNSVESLFSISRSLMGSLATDTEAICSIAQYIKDMDEDIAFAAGELNSNFYQDSKYLSFKDELNNINIDLTKVDVSMFSTKNESGKSGRVSSSEIMSATNSLISSLDLEVSDSNKIKTSIDTFISKVGSGNLLGNVWNDVKSSLEKYSSMMDIREDSSKYLSEALRIAAAYVIDYIGSDGELDDSKIPEIEEKIASIKSDIERLTLMCNAKHIEYSKYTKSDGTEGTKAYEVYDYSDSARAEFSSTIESNKIIKAELEAHLERLKGLAEVINKAQEIIEQALNCIKDNYGRAVNDIQNIKTFTFSADGINYKSILGDNFNKEDYLKIYNDFPNNIQEEKVPVNVQTPINASSYQAYTPSNVGVTPKNDGVKNESASEINETGTSKDVVEKDVKDVEQKEEVEQKETSHEVEQKEDNHVEQKEVNHEVERNEDNKVEVIKHNVDKPSVEPNVINNKIDNVISNEDTYQDVVINDEVDNISTSLGDEIQNTNIEPVIDNYTNVTQVESVSNNEVKTKDNTFSTIGKIAGIGAVVGAAAFGGYKVINDKKKEDN